MMIRLCENSLSTGAQVAGIQNTRSGNPVINWNPFDVQNVAKENSGALITVKQNAWRRDFVIFLWVITWQKITVTLTGNSTL